VRLRDEFLSVASHELKTPLTPLSLKLQVLARKAEAQPDSPFAREVQAHVEVGRRQVRKLGELIGDLLDVSRISAGRMKLTWESVDLAAVVREVVSRYEDQADKQGTLLQLEAPPSLVGTWDAMRLEQVVVNLLDNALKYGPGKPVRLRLVEDSGKAILTVKDEGIGIAASALGRVFDRFMRGVSDRHYGGLGLGLYITKSCVEAMGAPSTSRASRARGRCSRWCYRSAPRPEGSALGGRVAPGVGGRVPPQHGLQVVGLRGGDLRSGQALADLIQASHLERETILHLQGPPVELEPFHGTTPRLRR
jgi:signal transduction histidine kinase